jgi:uncharacterized protein
LSKDTSEQSRSLAFFHKSALEGNLRAYFELGKLYYKQKDLQNAMKYFKLASDYGNQKAKYNMAVIYGNKNYQEHNFKHSYDLFLDLAQRGNPKAQNKVGLFLLYGWGVDKDYKLAVQWFENAYFKRHYTPAVCNLSYMYANGFGVFPNFGRASVLAKIGIKKNLSRCKKIYEEFNLHKYPRDKSFKFGHYKNL